MQSISLILVQANQQLYLIFRTLKQKLASICSRHTACVPISTISQVTQWLASIREKSDEYENVANTLKRTLQEVESELEELKLENASANELVDVLKADSKDMQKQKIQEWHSRNMQLRIKVCVELKM